MKENDVRILSQPWMDRGECETDTSNIALKASVSSQRLMPSFSCNIIRDHFYISCVIFTDKDKTKTSYEY